MTKPIRAWAIISEDGILYDANGKTLALAIYPSDQNIPQERKAWMTDEDKIVEVLIAFPQKKVAKKKMKK